jgi:hypothetical protein
MGINNLAPTVERRVLEFVESGSPLNCRPVAPRLPSVMLAVLSAVIVVSGAHPAIQL